VLLQYGHLAAIRRGQAGIEVPTGVVTTLFGAVVLVVVARRFRDSGPVQQAPLPAPDGSATTARSSWSRP
jgi:hypothetical protein